MKKRAANRNVEVLRKMGAGCPDSKGTIPLNDINANKIVHPSILHRPWPAV
jgi:hypothetical protein